MFKQGIPKALSGAISANDVTKLQQICQENPQVNLQHVMFDGKSEPTNVMGLAAFHNAYQAIYFFSTKGIACAADYNGKPPLYWACVKNHADAAIHLMVLGHDCRDLHEFQLRTLDTVVAKAFLAYKSLCTQLTQGHLQGDELARAQKIINFVATWYTHHKERSKAVHDVGVTEMLSIIARDSVLEPDLCRFLQYMVNVVLLYVFSPFNQPQEQANFNDSKSQIEHAAFYQQALDAYAVIHPELSSSANRSLKHT